MLDTGEYILLDFCNILDTVFLNGEQRTFILSFLLSYVLQLWRALRNKCTVRDILSEVQSFNQRDYLKYKMSCNV